MPIDPNALESMRALLLGFALSGLVASAFELAFRQAVSFSLLRAVGARAYASVPVLVFSAPFIILRNTIRGRRIERRSVLAVMAATVLSGLWSLLCGRVVLDAAGWLAGG